MKKIITCLVTVLFFLTNSRAQDWKTTPIPEDVKNAHQWILDTQHSDDFNYEGKNAQFYKIWKDSYVNDWKGPGLTYFSSDHSVIKNGNLEIKAERKDPGNVYCGVISAKTPIIYPIFTEVRMKISGLKLSSNFWYISKDQVNEIDINETYGAEPKGGKTMGTNYHIFQREPFKDFSKEPKHFEAEGGPMLKDDYHRFGCYWKDPFTFYFYLDGKLVREMNIKDPRTPSVGFNQSLLMILDTEDHQWRSDKGIIATDEELKNPSQNTMYVDWVRVYIPKK
ncbi:family 16 glycosylhydrolase [Aquimarina algiphila]|uniref:family 16 glycosylhydrolase n=1 Tax=Aquimarina algiphila TaxID=2047982 RepID=UPI002491D299|nr:family 16 glycosylhydrolase [Aquimarina algiphila]